MLLLYIGMMATLYQVLLLIRLIGSYRQTRLHWFRVIILVIKALMFSELTRKIRICVIRLWYSIYLLLLGVYLINSDGWFPPFSGGVFNWVGLIYWAYLVVITALHYATHRRWIS